MMMQSAISDAVNERRARYPGNEQSRVGTVTPLDHFR